MVKKGSMILLQDGTEVMALSDSYNSPSDTSSPIPGWGSVYGFDAVDDQGEKKFVPVSKVKVWGEK